MPHSVWGPALHSTVAPIADRIFSIQRRRARPVRECQMWELYQYPKLTDFKKFSSILWISRNTRYQNEIMQ